MPPKNETIGAGWKKDFSGGSYISIKLNNGKSVALFANKNKQKDTHPDYRLIANYEDAEQMGLVSEYTIKKMAESTKQEEINLEDIPL